MQVETPRWFLPFFEPARYKGAFGGRGSSKSHTFAEALIEAHILNPDTSSVCVREIQKSLGQSVKRLLELKIEKMGVGPLFEVQEAQIKHKTGKGRIIFAGMQNHTSDSIKSLEGYDRAWVEEAQSLSQKSLDMLRPTIRKPGSELWFTWNPSKDSDPIDLLLRGENPPNGAIVQRVNYNDNPWFPDVLREEMEYDKRRDPDKYAHIWRGEYVRNSEARVFRNWKIEEFEAPPDAELRFGADFGFANDPTVLVRCHLMGRKLYIDYEAHQLGCEIVNTPALFLTVPESEKWPIVADCARPETISHLRKHGFPKVMPCVKGANSVIEGIEWLKSYDIVVHPRCRHVIDELTMYSYKMDSLTGLPSNNLQDANNHCLVAGTIIETDRGGIPIEDVIEGDLVLTRKGFQKVTFSGMTDVDRPVVRVETTNGTFVCTPDHEVYTHNKGFVRADALRYDDDLCVMLIESNTTEEHTEDTQAQSKELTGVTIAAQGQIEVQAGCIETFGKISLGRYLLDFISIIKTEILSIMRFQILSACPQRIISGNTLGMMLDSRSKPSILSELGHFQKHGMALRKVSRSTKRSERWLTKPLSRLKRIARNVMGHFSQRKRGTQTSSAPTLANQHGDGAKDSTTSQSNVCAEPRLSQTSTQKYKLAVGRVLTVSSAGVASKVYDLTVENEHEFFANGVLVSNCIDAVRYSLEGVRRIAKVTRNIVVPTPAVSHW